MVPSWDAACGTSMGPAPGAPPRPHTPRTHPAPQPNPDRVVLATPTFLTESAMVHDAMHRGAVQPNNASEQEFWPAVNHVAAALVESARFDGALW